MTRTQALDLDDIPASGDKLPRPRTCARCRFWGEQDHPKATHRWQLCLKPPVALAHQDFWCPAYQGRARP